VIKTIILSGDPPTLTQAEVIIKEFCPMLIVVGTAPGMKSGMPLLNQFQPDLIFLDTFLEDGSAFELLDHFSQPEFKVVFISDYAEYALKAIEYNAISYLLKPLDDQKFISIAQRAIGIIQHEEKMQVGAMKGNLQQMQEHGNIMLRTSDQIHLVKYSELVRVEADGNYSTFFVSDGRKVIVSKSMKEFEEKLLENGFTRIHKSHIINIKMMVVFDKAEGGYVVMSDQTRIPVSSRKRDDVVELFDELSKDPLK
jgi:two-component system LytT family response regulator